MAVVKEESAFGTVYRNVRHIHCGAEFNFITCEIKSEKKEPGVLLDGKILTIDTSKKMSCRISPDKISCSEDVD